MKGFKVIPAECTEGWPPLETDVLCLCRNKKGITYWLIGRLIDRDGDRGYWTGPRTDVIAWAELPEINSGLLKEVER